MPERWATFDCYGTLIDWNAGIGAQLERLLGGDRQHLLRRYHEAEPEVHVAQSQFHDIVPAAQLGLPTIWVNRLGEAPLQSPTRALPDLGRLADTLDELVQA